MTEINFEKLKSEVLSEFRKNLPEHLYYHCPEHTERVIDVAEFIAEKEKISGKDLLLIKIAALYHDYGFISVYENHEEASCKAVKRDLSKWLDSKDIDKVCGIILATQIPQVTNNKLEEVLADADLEYLGTDDFTKISNDLYLELKHQNPEFTLEQWDKIQIKFFENHSYFTDYAKTFLAPKKMENLEKIKNK